MGNNIPPYRKLLQNHSMPPRGTGLVCDPSSRLCRSKDLTRTLLPSANRAIRVDKLGVLDIARQEEDVGYSLRCAAPSWWSLKDAVS
jgi:hypothetical protein